MLPVIATETAVVRTAPARLRLTNRRLRWNLGALPPRQIGRSPPEDGAGLPVLRTGFYQPYIMPIDQTFRRDPLQACRTKAFRHPGSGYVFNHRSPPSDRCRILPTRPLPGCTRHPLSDHSAFAYLPRHPRWSRNRFPRTAHPPFR